MRLFFIAAIVVAVDQLTKHLVSATIEMGQSIAVIENFLYITYVLNPGAAFGMLPYRTIFLVAVTLVVLGFIVYFYRTLPPGYAMLRVGLALMLGGALGNLVDRVSSSYVVDFIKLTIWPPVFNLADTAIVGGIALFLIAFWRMSPFMEKKDE